MRYYAIHLAESHVAPSRGSTVLRFIRNWFVRRRLAKLSDLDLHLLKDIGLTHHDLKRVSRLPLSSNPLEEIERILSPSGRYEEGRWASGITGCASDNEGVPRSTTAD